VANRTNFIKEKRMANDINKIIMVARLTRDPETKTVGSSTIVNFGVANNRSYSSNGEKKEETHYFECEAWGKLAEIIAKYATKGKQVAIDGRLKYESWTGKDGSKASRVKIFVDGLQLLGSNENKAPHSFEQAGTQVDNPLAGNDPFQSDDEPF
jgi:single-strand DNA-binding protein